jgi:hypothetical protein
MVITIIAQRTMSHERTLNAISVWCRDEHKCVLQIRNNVAGTIDLSEPYYTEQGVMKAFEEFNEAESCGE